MEKSTQAYMADVRQLIAENELEQALKQLRQFLSHAPQLDEALQQSGRFAAIRKQIRLGTVSQADATLTQNQIRAALLDLLREIDTQQAQSPALGAEMERAVAVVHSKNVVVGNVSAGGNVNIGDTTTITESQTSRRLRLFLFLFVPLLTLGIAFLWYKTQPVSLTVVAKHTHRIADLPFQKGNLVLYHGDKPDSKTIESEVIFTGISRGETVRLHFDAPGFMAMDTAFAISGNQVFQLPVRRDSSLMRIAGVVKDIKGNPVAACQITVAGVSTTSDATGRYALEVPYLQQRRQQAIRAVKDGREGFNETHTIVPNEDNDILFQHQ